MFVDLVYCPGGGGLTTIYDVTGCAIFWGAVFRAEN